MMVVHGTPDAARALKDRRAQRWDDLPDDALVRSSAALGQPVSTVEEAVRLILDRVREGGDSAIRDLAEKLDGDRPGSLEVSARTIANAYEQTPRDVVEALRLAAERAREFHQVGLPKSWFDEERGYGEVVNPVERVGAYVPGGSAPLPSTAIMTAVPARVAGVSEVIVCTPPGPGGDPAPAVLVAADLVGVDRVFRIGGAQAIAAMAYGAETVPAVDMLCGPGSVFVTAAKRLLFGEVGIDGLYGPTETLLIADETANPTLCAADLLAQAEHDVMAAPILVTTSNPLAQDVLRELDGRAERLKRGAIARQSLDRRGCIAVVDSLDDAFDLANEFAPEHVSLMVREPRDHAAKIRNAGAIFAGEFSHEVLGDYVAGPSHVMPTGGTARFGSGLNVRTFVKISPIVALDDASSLELGRAAAAIGRAEGLTAHAEAAEIREELNVHSDPSRRPRFLKGAAQP